MPTRLSSATKPLAQAPRRTEGRAAVSSAALGREARTIRLPYQRQLRRGEANQSQARWAPRATLLFSGGISAALWAAIIAGILALFR